MARKRFVSSTNGMQAPASALSESDESVPSSPSWAGDAEAPAASDGGASDGGMSDGGGSDEGIAFGARIGYVQMCAAHRHGVVHGQDSIVEGGDDVTAHPGAQEFSL